MARRARTKQLIELGALVQKAGLVTVTGDDRVLLFGALLDMAQRLGAPDQAELTAQLRRRASRAIAGEAASAAAARGEGAPAGIASPRAIPSDDEKGGTGDS